MDEWRIETCERAERYAQRNGRSLIGQLGYGYDGTVFATDGQSAIKTLRFERLYQQERNIYQRLHSLNIVEVAGFSVPQFINFDDELWTIEMGIVSPPFVLDFAGAYLDKRPDYPEDVLEEWQADKLEQFGQKRWDAVQSVMARFAGMGIYLADVKPGNIMFED